MQEPACALYARRLFQCVRVPAHLPSILAQPLRVFQVGFEIDDHPTVIFDKCQNDDGFEEAGNVVFDDDGKFAIPAFGLARAFQ